MIKRTLSKVKFGMTPEEGISLHSEKSSDLDLNDESTKSSVNCNNGLLPCKITSSPSLDISFCDKIDGLTKSIDADFEILPSEQMLKKDAKMPDADLFQEDQVSTNISQENIHSDPQSSDISELNFQFSNHSSIKSLLFESLNNNKCAVLQDRKIQCSLTDIDQSLSENGMVEGPNSFKNDNCQRPSFRQSESYPRSDQRSCITKKYERSSSSNSVSSTKNLTNSEKSKSSTNLSLSDCHKGQGSNSYDAHTGQRPTHNRDNISGKTVLNHSIGEKHHQNGWLSKVNKKGVNSDQILNQSNKLDALQTGLNGHKILIENSDNEEDDDNVDDKDAYVKLIHSEQRTSPESDMCDCCFLKIPFCFHRKKTLKEKNVYIAMETKNIPLSNSVHPTERSPCLFDIDT